MALQLKPETGNRRHIITLDEYERMCQAGVFEPEARIELIRGEITDMAPPGPDHETSVARLNLLFVEQCGRRALVWPQGNSVRLPKSNSRPQPDVTILRWRDDLYAGKPPRPDDVMLLVEVADSSLKFDRGNKLQLYAEAGIEEYWVVNLVDGVVEVYQEPSESTYQRVRIAHPGETLALPGDLGGAINVGEILSREQDRGIL